MGPALEARALAGTLAASVPPLLPEKAEAQTGKQPPHGHAARGGEAVAGHQRPTEQDPPRQNFRKKRPFHVNAFVSGVGEKLQ